MLTAQMPNLSCASVGLALCVSFLAQTQAGLDDQIAEKAHPALVRFVLVR